MDVATAFTCQMRDNSVELFRIIVNKVDFCPNGARVLRIGFGIENEAAANLDPNAGADVLK